MYLVIFSKDNDKQEFLLETLNCNVFNEFVKNGYAVYLRYLDREDYTRKLR